MAAKRSMTRASGVHALPPRGSRTLPNPSLRTHAARAIGFGDPTQSLDRGEPVVGILLEIGQIDGFVRNLLVRNRLQKMMDTVQAGVALHVGFRPRTRAPRPYPYA